MVYKIPGITLRAFQEANEMSRNLFQAFFKKEPTLSNQYGAYFENHPKDEFVLVEFSVWNHSDNFRIKESDIRATDPDAEEITNRYKAELAELEGIYKPSSTMHIENGSVKTTETFRVGDRVNLVKPVDVVRPTGSQRIIVCVE